MDFNALLFVIPLTLFPGIELRGGIAYGIASGLDPFLVFVVSVAVNILVIIPIYIFLEFLFHYFENLPGVRGIVSKTREKTQKYVEKYGFIGLAVFVGIPFPGTGVYSAALGAHLLGIKRRVAIPAMVLGVFIAAIIVVILSIGIFGFIL